MSRPFLLGLTGSIGMGKSTTAGFFAKAGVAVWDADTAVHAAYSRGGGGAAAIGAIAPSAVVDGAVDRGLLRAEITEDPSLLARVEAAIHPVVAASRAEFVARHAGNDVLLLDIPLLYETGADVGLDAVLLVTAPPEVQRARVLARPGMGEAALARILDRQMPDAEKRRRADFVIETDRGLEAARRNALSVLECVREERRDA